jgi:hypothetical protein
VREHHDTQNSNACGSGAVQVKQFNSTQFWGLNLLLTDKRYTQQSESNIDESIRRQILNLFDDFDFLVPFLTAFLHKRPEHAVVLQLISKKWKSALRQVKEVTGSFLIQDHFARETTYYDYVARGLSLMRWTKEGYNITPP